MRMSFIFGFILLFIGFLFFFTGVHNEDLAHNFLILEERYNLELNDVTITGNVVDYYESYRTAPMFEISGLLVCMIGSLLLGHSQKGSIRLLPLKTHKKRR